MIGLFLSVGPQDHPEFEKICKRFIEIQNAKNLVTLEDDIDLNNFLPDNRDFFTYLGSLTTPSLYESVTWMVFRQDVKISQRQVCMKTKSSQHKIFTLNLFSLT